MDNISQEIENELNDFLYDKNITQNDTITTQHNIIKCKKNKLIFGGGGIKGLSLIGVLKALEIKNILQNINTFVGVSVGSIMLMAYILGYTPDEMYTLMDELHLENMMDIRMNKFFKDYGVDNGNKIEEMFKQFIKDKNYNENITLLQLYENTKKDFIIVTTCLNTIQPVYLNHKTHPNLPLSMAIRMSISIPFYYTPVLYNGMTFADGGCSDSFPIQLFKDDLDTVIGTFIITEKNCSNKIDNLESYLSSVFNCIMNRTDNIYTHIYDKYIIKIPIPSDVSMIDYGIDKSKKKQFFNVGFNKTIEYIHKM